MVMRWYFCGVKLYIIRIVVVVWRVGFNDSPSISSSVIPILQRKFGANVTGTYFFIRFLIAALAITMELDIPLSDQRIYIYIYTYIHIYIYIFIYIYIEREREFIF